MTDINKFDLLPDYVNNINTRKVVYIGPTGTSGYAAAAQGYLYDLIRSNTSLLFIPYVTGLDKPNDADNSEFMNILNQKQKTILNNPTEIIIHSLPEGWNTLLKNTNVKYTTQTKIVGRTVWEFDKLPDTWVNNINNSLVTEVSVPTNWNKEVFIKSGVTKPIVVEPHIYVDFAYTPVTLKSILTKSLFIGNTPLNVNYDKYHKIYCINQLIDRKGITATLEAFCEAFTEKDKVVFFLKTFRNDYSLQEQVETAKYIESIVSKYPKHAPIFYIKDKLSFNEIRTLHDFGDCYFSLTKAEGFGLGIFDAFNKNHDIIVTGYGGHVEYLKKEYPGLVPYTLEPLSIEIYKGCYLDESYSWAIADKKEAIKLLKLSYTKKINTSVTINSVPESILYIGQYGTSGYATAAKQYVANYVIKGIPIRWEPLYFDESVLDDNYVNILAKSTIDAPIDYNTVILHCTPDLWPIYIKKYAKRFEGKRIIGYTVWETNLLKEEWVNGINSVSEVWCPSKYNKDVFIDSGVTIPVKVVPHIFFPNTLPDKKTVTINGTIENYYTFYNISEFTERKNVKELLECFCQQFKKEDKVQLILKTHFKNYSLDNVKYCKTEINKILLQYPDHANVVVIYESLEEAQLLALHSYGDCYITLTRSEGFGLTVFESFHYGKDVIATGYSGHVDFLGEKYKGLIDYKLIEVKNMENFNAHYNHKNQQWAQPNLIHTKQLMQNYYETSNKKQ